MRLILLTRGKVATIDDEDFSLISRWKWFAAFRHGQWYAARGEKSSETGSVRIIYMHGFLAGAGSRTIHVDHRDNDGLNNCRCNLRVCSPQENQRNSRKHIVQTSRYKGVHLIKSSGRWRARINTPRPVHLGCFATELEAAAAYDRAAKMHFGDFCALNLGS